MAGELRMQQSAVHCLPQDMSLEITCGYITVIKDYLPPIGSYGFLRRAFWS